MEIWKNISNYPDYQISNLGNVRSNKTKKTLKPHVTKQGYCIVNLYNNGIDKHFKVHRLVALHFIENKLNKKTINHKDGNKLNNNIDNLEWHSHSENHLHAYKKLNRQAPSLGKKGKNAFRSIPVCQLDLRGNLIKIFDSQKIAAEELGISNTHISSVCKGIRKQTGGFVWKYVK